MKNQIFNQTNSSMENIPVHTELYMVFSLYLEKREKSHSFKTEIVGLGSIASIFHPNCGITLREETIHNWYNLILHLKYWAHF